MNFFRMFWWVLWIKPGVALTAVYWRLIGKKVRASGQLRRQIGSAPFAYQLWIDMVERETERLNLAGETISRWQVRPVVSVVVQLDDDADDDWLSKLAQVLRTQPYPDWELVVCGSKPPGTNLDGVRYLPTTVVDPGEVLGAAIASSVGAFVLPVQAGSMLSRQALYRLVAALQDRQDACFVYGDHDRVDLTGRRHAPWFKPEPDLDMGLAQDYFSHIAMVDRSLAGQFLAEQPVSGRDAFSRLLLSIWFREVASGKIVHVPHICAHWRTDPAVGAVNAARANLVNRLLAQEGGSARAAPGGTLKLSWPLPEPRPLISIIIPTRDKHELLRACIESICRLSTYRDFELLVIDNSSSDPQSLDYLAEISATVTARVIPFPADYNFAAINNHAATLARGDYLCLLNNDTEVLSHDWLETLLAQAARPGVGAVGAKLLYPDGSIQHAGVVIGMGAAAGHAHRFSADEADGYFRQAHIQRGASAVTAACLMVAKRKFDAVGGFDAEHFAIAYNDVDLCLKLNDAGWRTIYEPNAVLVHHESKSRINDFDPARVGRYMEELSALQRRWKTKHRVDPMHHVVFDQSCETYQLGFEHID